MTRDKSLNFYFLTQRQLIVLSFLVTFSCVEKEKNTGSQRLLDCNYFQVSQLSIDHSTNSNEISYYRFDDHDSLLMVWNTVSGKVKILTYPDLENFQEFDLDSIASFSPIIDSYWQNGCLYAVGLSNEFTVFCPVSTEKQSFKFESRLKGLEFRAFSVSDFPIYVEDSTVFLHGNASGLPNFMSGNHLKAQELFFSAPLEITYDMKTGEVQSFGKYPQSYRNEVMEFYYWTASRKRLFGESIYSFAHIDSLYVNGDSRLSETMRIFSRKSILRQRKIVQFDKSRLYDYAYINDYSYVNDRYADLITDTHRKLVYSVFVPGVDTPEERRLHSEQMAFTILVFNSDYEIQKEVFFPPGVYDHRFHFVTPEGLCLLKIDSTVATTQRFDVFDMTKEGHPVEIDSKSLYYKVDLPPLGRYLRHEVAVDLATDSLIVISGLGCGGCLANLIIEAEKKGKLYEGFAFVATLDAARSQTVSEFLSRQPHSYIDESGQLGDFRAIGDFLTLIVLDGDSIVKVDNKFAF